MNKNRIITVIVVALASAMGSTLVPRIMHGSKEFQISSGIAKVCNEINKNCPLSIDKNTRLDATVPGSNEIIYQYTIIGLQDQEVMDKKDKIIEINSQRVKTNPQTKKMIDEGVTMTYFYRNEQGKFLFQFSVNK